MKPTSLKPRLRHRVHQTHIKQHAKTILLMLIKRHIKKYIYIITIHYSINKKNINNKKQTKKQLLVL